MFLHLLNQMPVLHNQQGAQVWLHGVEQAFQHLKLKPGLAEQQTQGLDITRRMQWIGGHLTSFDAQQLSKHGAQIGLCFLYRNLGRDLLRKLIDKGDGLRVGEAYLSGHTELTGLGSTQGCHQGFGVAGQQHGALPGPSLPDPEIKHFLGVITLG